MVAADPFEFEDAVVVKSSACHHRECSHLQRLWRFKPIGVNAQHGIWIRALHPGFDQNVIPVLDRPHVAVDLQQDVFSVVKTLGLASGPAGATTIGCSNMLDLQMGVIRKRRLAPVQWIRCIQLQADAEVQPFRMRCARQQVVQCRGQIRIAVRGDLHKNRLLFVTHWAQSLHQSVAAMRRV